MEVLLPEHDADLGVLAHAAREPPDGGAVPRQIAQRLAHHAASDTVLAHHLGDARAEERRGDRDHTAPQPDTPKIPPCLLVVVNGFLVLVALSALISIWFARTGGD